MGTWKGVIALKRDVHVLLLGNVLNTFGTGLVFPFMGVYLREVAGLSISRTGLVLATFGLAGIAATPVAGSLTDRFGARRVCVGLLLMSAAGYLMFLAVESFVGALIAATVAGAGSGAFNAPNSALLAEITTETDRTTVFAANRALVNFGIGLGGLCGGLLAVNGQEDTYARLFILDAATYFLFAGLIWSRRHLGSGTQRTATQSRPPFWSIFTETLSNPWFRKLVFLDLGVALVFAGGFELLPVHAVARLGVSNASLGVLFALSCAAVTMLQFPAVRVMAGRRRMRAYVFMYVGFAVMMASIALAPKLSHAGVLALLAVVVVGLGAMETIFGAVRPAITTEIFPPELHGRAFAASQTIFGLGQVAVRAGGGALLDRSSYLPWLLAGALLLGAAFAADRLERTMPAGSRLNPMG